MTGAVVHLHAPLTLLSRQPNADEEKIGNESAERAMGKITLTAGIIALLAFHGVAQAETILLECVYTAHNDNPKAAIVGRRFNLEIDEHRLLVDNINMNATVTIGQRAISYKWLIGLLKAQVDGTIDRASGKLVETTLKLETMAIVVTHRATCTKATLPPSKF